MVRWTALTLLLGAAGAARAQIVPESTPMATWGVNGEVRALARVGRTLYVGGTFDTVGPPSGGLAFVEAQDASEITPSSGVSVASKVVADGAGGWYVTQWPSDDVGSSVVHVRPDGSLDPTWARAVFGPSTSIYGLVAAGGRVYVSGSFADVNGVNRSGAVALDGVTGAVLPWTLTTRTGGAVFDAVFMTGAGDRVYFAIRSPSPDILAIDAATGARLPFQPQPPPRVESILQLAAGPTRVFAIGEGCGAAAPTPGICAFDAATGALAWTWAPAAPARVRSVFAGTERLYVHTDPPDVLEARDQATGAPSGWTVPAIGGVWGLAEGHGRTYIAASHGTQASAVRAFDIVTAAELPWRPGLSNGLDVATQGAMVAVGGQFSLAGGVQRRNLVALNLDTGRPAAVQPAEPAGPVHSLAVHGDLVFTGVESATSEVYAFSAASGHRVPWSLPLNGRALSLLVAGQTLYVGGFFSQLGGEPRQFLGAVDLTTGALLPWNPRPGFQVSELTATSTRLFAAGTIGGPYGSSTGAAAFDLATRQPAVFEWPTPLHSATRYLAATGDRLLMTSRYLSPPGAFSVAWLDPSTGAVRSDVLMPFWPVNASGSSGTVVVGGQQLTSGPVYLAAFDATTGARTAWSPVARSRVGPPLSAGLSAILVQPDFVAVGGALSNVNGRQVTNLAVFRATAAMPPPPRALTAAVSGVSATVSWLSGGSADTFVVEAGSSSGATNVGVFPVGPATSASGTLGAGRYFVRVKGVSAAGVSPASSEVILDVPPTSAPPAAPSGLTGTVTAGVVTLRWQAAAGNATSYRIEAGAAPGLANLAVLATGHLDTTFVTSAPSGTYHVRVRATNAFGQSDPSNEIVVIVP